MSSLADLSINFKPFCKVDFSGGDLSSDCGLLLIGQFMKSMGITSFIRENFGADISQRGKHSDADILLQLLYQNMAGYPTDDMADHLAHDPVMKTLLHKERLASQPTISRFRHRLGHVSQIELNGILAFLRRQAYKVQRPKTRPFCAPTASSPAPNMSTTTGRTGSTPCCATTGTRATC